MVLALTWFGVALPHVVASVLGTLALAIGVAALGASWWNRRRESVDVAFGELMLWRFIRRRRADRRAGKNVREVDLGPDRAKSKVIRLEQDRSLEVLHRLTLALEATDPYTLGHSRRVERHVHRTAMAMGLSTSEIRELRIAAALHDVGKICVPEQILRKSDPLTLEERSIMRDHVSVGAMMVAGAASRSVTEAILHHHEFWDGRGYPSGLSGEDIPLYARIIALGDVWDAITSARPYKGGEARSHAIGVLQEGAGSQFDPDLVDVFLKGLPAALPVTSALLIFLTQHRATRPAYEWTHSSVFTEVSKAAAAGTAAAVITVGAITPQILTATGSDSSREPAERAATEHVDLIRERSTDLGGLMSTSWGPRLRASTFSASTASRELEDVVDSVGPVLVPPSGAIAGSDQHVAIVLPPEEPSAEAPPATAPPTVTEPSPVPVEPPAPASPPIDVYVPPAPVDPGLPSDPDPVLETPGDDVPVAAAPSGDVSTHAIVEELVPPAEPGNSEEAPGHEEAGPGNSEEAPGHLDEVAIVEELVPPAEPGNSEEAPGHEEAGPGNSEEAPGHLDEVAIVEELVPPAEPGNSEEAPGHDPAGPGNSENAPGHLDEAVLEVPVAPDTPSDLDGSEWVSEGEQWLDEVPQLPTDAAGHAHERGGGQPHSSSPWNS
jgi:hypothetical protein